MPEFDTLMTLVSDRHLPHPLVARLFRAKNMLTQGDIATELGVNRCTVSRWETGVRSPRGEHRVRYARLLRTLIEEGQ